MKEKYYPNYVNEYRRIDGKTIKVDRRCSDGGRRFVCYMNYDTVEECSEAWEKNCGA